MKNKYLESRPSGGKGGVWNLLLKLQMEDVLREGSATS